MKAYVLHGINDLRYEDVNEPEIPEGWALVEVKAAGICGSDIPRIYETGTYHFPTIPGHEFSGKVAKVSAGGNKELIGKKVGVFPLIPCKSCRSCIREEYEMCSNYNYLGSRTDGGFAEYVIAPEWNLIPLPDEVSYEEAAMLEPMAVGIHALRQVPLDEIKNIVIFGLGPIGMMMAQWARILGLEDILLVANKAPQAELAQRLGFTRVCDSSKDNVRDWIMKNTDGIGADLVVEGVGSNRVLSDCLEVVRAKGNVLIVGNPKDNLQLDKALFWKIHRNQLRLYGTWNSSYTGKPEDDWHQSVQALKEGKMNAKALITHFLDWDELDKGLKIMKEKTEYSCKVMITR